MPRWLLIVVSTLIALAILKGTYWLFGIWAFFGLVAAILIFHAVTRGKYYNFPD